MHLLTFIKEERLSKKKSIDKLFREGSSFYTYPFKVYWLAIPQETDTPAQILVMVGKRAFKRAVDRNRIRRQIREIYRHHKTGFYELLSERRINCLLCFIYTSGNMLEYKDLEKKIKSVLRRLENEIDLTLNNNNRILSIQ